MNKYTIGPDINLDKEKVYQPDGTRLTEARSRKLADDTLRFCFRSEEGEAVMAELSEDEQKALAAINESIKERESTPEADRKWVSRPERYNYPIGFDDSGNKFPIDDADEKHSTNNPEEK